MHPRCLFGPVTASFADDHLHGLRQAGLCLPFDRSGATGCAIGLEDTWDDVCLRLPDGWQPEAVVLALAYTTIPPVLWQAPVPILGLAADANLLWHYYRRVLPRCDLVLTDLLTHERLREAGLTHVVQANLYGLGRSYLETPQSDGPRDIDVLFVGNLHPAVQRERLAWLGRLARLAQRWNVVIRTGCFDAEYRALLNRARIVFNRSVRQECNMRTLEATASGALLFQEADNREVPAFFDDGQEYVAYGDDNLGALLDYYLTQEAERTRIAEAGRRRALSYGFEALWQSTLERLAGEWPTLRERCQERCSRLGAPRATAASPVASSEVTSAPVDEDLMGRVEQALSVGTLQDPTLPGDLEAALLAQPFSAALSNARGLIEALASQRSSGLTAASAQIAARYFQRALICDPHQPVIALNLIEALVGMGQEQLAVEGAQRCLQLVEQGVETTAGQGELPHFPPAFDLFRVEWERAAWDNPGSPPAERSAKVALLRWRLHSLMADLTGQIAAYQEAAQLRPDLPASQAALGCAWGRAGQPALAIEPLRQAVAANPFDLPAARALFHALGEVGDSEGQQRLAADYRLLTKAAPQTIAGEPWFAEPAAPMSTLAPPAGPSPLKASGEVPQAEEAKPLAVIWEGDQLAIHSLALINRQVCRRLWERGHDLALLAGKQDESQSERLGMLGPLAAALGRALDRPADVHVRHQWPPQLTPPPEGRWVLMQPWEFGSLPKDWIDPLVRAVDEVWVPSRHVRDCFISSGVPAELVQVIPLGIDPTRFHPGVPPLPLRTRKRFKFLFVGGTIQRKGIDILLEAYTRTFHRGDEVCLVIKDMGVGTFYRGQTAEGAIAEIQKAAAAPEIEYLDGELSDDELAGLYASCDCLVHPYRGEGFGLPIVEAMACGLPVIVTGLGPAREYCTPALGYLLPARPARFAEKRLGDWETVNYPWLAEPDRDVLRELLRHVVAHSEEARAKGQAASAHMNTHYTWDRTAAAVEWRLHQLSVRPIRRDSLRGAPGPIEPTAPRPPRGRVKVSLCLIVKNEEANLPGCLESAAGLFDEIIVVDTGSTDPTRQIAARFGAKVVEFPWCDSFAAARNESLRHARSEWIFWMDADDRLDAANREKLQALLANLPEENAAYVLKCLCLAGGDGHAPTAVDHVRLFRNHPALRWQHRVHEQILPAVRATRGNVRFTDIVIHHTGYTDPALRRRKLERDLRLLRLEEAEQPEHPFTLFNLGLVCQELERNVEAVAYLRRSLALSHPEDSIVRKLYAAIAGCHKALGQFEEALAACQEGRRHYPNDPELLFVEGALRRDREDLEGAIACFEQAQRPQAGPHFASVDAGLASYKAQHNVALLYRRQGRLAEAEARWRATLAEFPHFWPAKLGLAELYLDQERWSAFEEAVRQLEQDPHGAEEAQLLQARRHLTAKEFEDARSSLHQVIGHSPRAVLPRILLSYVLLQEGRDPAAAEEALRAVLVLDPDNAEARHNLAILLSTQNRASDAVVIEGTSLASLYHAACQTSAAWRACLPKVFELASQCRHVTALGSGQSKIATALLFAQPETLVCYDSDKLPQMDRLKALAGQTLVHVEPVDAPDAIDSTDLLVLDAGAIGQPLPTTLRRLVSQVRKYLVVLTADEENRTGLPPALEEFLAEPSGRFRRRSADVPGLAILEVCRPWLSH